MQTIDIKLNKSVIAKFKKTASLDAEYIDFNIFGKHCIVFSENKGLMFAGLITLESKYEDVSFRISNQIVKQITKNSLLRIFIKENSIELFLFYEDLNLKPIKITCLNSRSYIKSLDSIKSILLHKTVSDNSFLEYMGPIVQVSKLVSSLDNRNLLISDGIVFIDNPEYKFFADLGKSGLNLIVPDSITKQMKYELDNPDCDFIISDGMNQLRCGDYLYCWKNVRVMQVNEYAQMKKMKPKCRCAIDLSSLVGFLEKLSISKNRNQKLYLDVEHGVGIIDENSIINYEVPIHCNVTGGAMYENISVDMKSLLAITKNLNSSLLMLDIHDKFIVFTRVIEDTRVGDIPYSFLLRLGR